MKKKDIINNLKKITKDMGNMRNPTIASKNPDYDYYPIYKRLLELIGK